MTSRVHLYPPRDDEREIRACILTVDRELPESVHHYTVKLGIADQYGVDYHATYDGSKQKVEKNVPYVLYASTPLSVRDGQSVVADISVSGMPPPLAGASIHLVMGDTAADPAQRVFDREILSAVDGVTDWVKAIHGDEDVVTVVLPKIPFSSNSTQSAHSEDATQILVSSASLTNGLVSVDLGGTRDRPLMAFVTVHATIVGDGATETLEVAINDGATDQNPHSTTQAVVGDSSHVSTTYATPIYRDTTFTLRYRRLSAAAPSVVNQSITALAVEV